MPELAATLRDRSSGHFPFAGTTLVVLTCAPSTGRPLEGKMITFNCTIQEGIVPHEIRPRLASELARISTSFVGGNPDDVAVNWIEIPHGFGFRGGKISTTSAVRGEIPPGLQQETRVELMQAIQDMWMDHTGCTTDELVVSARDRR